MVFYKGMKNQNWLFPPNILDLIPENHICFLVDEVIESMDFSEVEKGYDGPGHPAYHPRIMLKLLVMGTIDGVRSSRRIARAAGENVVYMFLAGKLRPDFRTVSDFRKNNPELVSEVFKWVVEYAQELGMANLGHVSIDGTKIRANASNEKFLSKNEIELLERIVNEIEEGIRVDEKEEEEENPYEMNEKVMEKFKESKEKKRIQNVVEIAEEDPQKFRDKIEKMKEVKSKASYTDPECRYMHSNGLHFCYNGQVSFDSSGIIVARDVVSDETDYCQLIPQLEEVKANAGEYPEELSADNGYYSVENLMFLFEKDIDGYIPDENTTRAIKGENSRKEELSYNVEGDYFECEHGRITFRYQYYDKNKKRQVWIYKGESCHLCPIQKDCVSNKKGIKTVKRYMPEKIRVEMLKKMKGKGLEKYELRKKIEKVFGHFKLNLGLRQFLTRGLERVKVEFDLACIAYNLRRIWNSV